MRLPLEVLSEILDNFCLNDTLCFMTVSRSFHGACARRLYTTILLDDIAKAQKCFETLAFNSALAGSVRKLTVRSNQPVNTAALSQFTRTLRSALRNIAPGLVALELNISGFDPSPHMKRMHCSWLKILSISCPIGPDIMSFIIAHPGIEHLEMIGLLSLPEIGKRNKLFHRKMQVAMPALRRITGPFDVMPIFLPGSRPTSVEVIFTSPVPISENAEQDLVNFLPQATSLGLIGFGAFRFSLFDLIGDKLKGLVKLKLSLRTIAQAGIVLDGLSTVLPFLPHLYHLHFYPLKDELDPDIFTSAGLELDFCMLSSWSALQESLCVCEMSSRLPWARLKTSGHWLPILPTEITLKWWLAQTSLLTPMQENIVSAILKTGVFDPETQAARDEECGDTDPYSKCTHISRTMALAVGHVINRAYNLPDSIDHADPSNSDPTLDVLLQQMLLPVNGPNGQRIEAYTYTTCKRPALQSRSVQERWDLSLTMLGLAALHPVKETTLDLGASPDFPSVGLIPFLNEEQKEIFTILLDVVYNSSDGVEGIELANYLRNPGNCWGKDRIVAIFESGGFISPTGLPSSLLNQDL